MRFLFQVLTLISFALLNQACKQDGLKSTKIKNTSETSGSSSKNRCEHVPDWSNYHSHTGCEQNSPPNTDYCTAFTDSYGAGQGGGFYFGEGFTRASCEQACASVLADVISYSVDYGYCRFGSEDIIWDTFSPDFDSYVANFNSSGDGESGGGSSAGSQLCTVKTDGYGYGLGGEWFMGIFDNQASCESACQNMRSQLVSYNNMIGFENQAYGYSVPMINGYCHFGDGIVWSYGSDPYTPSTDSGGGTGSGDGDYGGGGGGY